jgi:hypothetical protein
VAIRYTHYPSVDLYLDEHGMREIPYSLLSYCVVDLVSIIIGNDTVYMEKKYDKCTGFQL